MFVSQQEVLEMECRLFFSRFKNQDTVLRMQEKISTSRSTHQAHAFKLGLQAALDLKKRGSQIGCVMLQCTQRNCPGRENDTAYSLESVGNSVFCQPCHGIGQLSLLICTGCRSERTDRDSSCHRCGKKFGLVVSKVP